MTRFILLAVFLLTSEVQAQPLECKTIQDSLERLRCFDAQAKPAASPPTTTPSQSNVLDFTKLRAAMNAKYKNYFAHHNTTLTGSKTEGSRKIFYIKVPDPNPELLITANCEQLDGGGWMCMLKPNYGNFGVLPLPIKG